MVAALAAQAEGARVAEVRNAEVISIVDPAIPAQKRVSPNRSGIVMFAAVLGLVLALVVAVLRHNLQPYLAPRVVDLGVPADVPPCR